MQKARLPFGVNNNYNSIVSEAILYLIGEKQIMLKFIKKIFLFLFVLLLQLLLAVIFQAIILEFITNGEALSL